MKVILLKEAPGLGKEGDLLEVSDGHARNHLIPKGLALRATDGLKRQAETIQKNRAIKDSQDIETAKEIAARLNSITLNISAEASPEGKLYGSISSSEIVKVIEDEQKIILDKSSIKLSKSIKEVGSFKIQISPHSEVSFEMAVEVSATPT